MVRFARVDSIVTRVRPGEGVICLDRDAGVAQFRHEGAAETRLVHEDQSGPLAHPSSALCPTGGEGWGEWVRFMGSFGLQIWTRIGTMNLGRTRPASPHMID